MKLSYVALIFGLTATLVHCTGSDGAGGAAGPAGQAGAQGTPGPAGSGATGAQGPAGLSAGDGGTALPASCLSPCHGFNGIVEQWKTSTHYATFVSNLGGDEVTSWTQPGAACGNCHAEDALTGRTTNAVGVVGDAGVTNLASGELNYKSPTGSLAEASYIGNSKVASVACVTCHAVTDDNDPHRTGLPWTPGSFPFRVPTGTTDQAFIEKSPTAGTVTGTAVGALGASNTCIWCHRSRKDVTNYITPTANKLTSTHWGPHEGPQADVFSGKGGYHFTGQTYGQSTHQQQTVCADCHMPDMTTNQNAPNHSFFPQLSACLRCHTGATSFDVAGGQSTVKGMMFEFQKDLNNAGYLTRNETAPYSPLSGSQLTDAAFSIDLTNPTGGPGNTVPSLTADQAGALYNYIIIARGGAMGVHNPLYVKQLIFDSIKALTGSAPTTLPVRPN